MIVDAVEVNRKIENFIKIYENKIIKHFDTHSTQRFYIKNNEPDTARDGARTKLISYADAVYTWIPLNPNKEEVCDAIKESMLLLNEEYAETDEEKGKIQTLPGINGFKNLFSAIVNKNEVKTIFVYGQRGSGKTFCINYFLSEYHSKLCDSGITWFRVDIAKMWEILEIKNMKYTIEQYLLSHMYYVIFTYAARDSVLNIFLTGNENFNSSSYIKYITDKYQDDRSFRNLCLEIWFKALKEIDNNNQRQGKKSTPFTEFFIDNVISKIDSDKIIKIIKSLTKYIEKNQKQAIFLIDGIDNIKYRKEELIFQDFLKTIRYGLNNVLTQHKLIYSMRPDTYSVNKKFTIPHEVSKNNITFTIQNPEPKLLLKHKLKLLESENKYFYNCRIKAYGNNETYAIDQIRNFVTISQQLTNQLLIEDEIKTNFGGNLRSFLRNHIRACDYRARYEHLRGNIIFSAEALQIYREGSMLAGYNYMYDNDIDAVKGKWLPNIFAIGSNDRNRWSGLITLRILQLIRDFWGKFDSVELYEILSTVFKYEESAFDEALNMCYDFRLIEIVPDSAPDKNGQAVHRYKIADKGRRILDLIVGDELTLSALYFMAQRTKMHYGSEIDSEVHVVQNFPDLVHNPSNPNIRKFQEASILASSVLLRHIYISHLKEINLLNSSDLSKLSAKYALDKIKRSFRISIRQLNLTRSKTLRKTLGSLAFNDNGNRLDALTKSFNKLHDSLER